MGLHISTAPSGLEALLAPVLEPMQLVERRMAQAIEAEQPYLAQAYAALLSGGKRLRPAVTLLCAGAEHSRSRPVVAMAAALEMLHAATLIHDDIIDEAPVRRGKPTIVATSGADSAILAGDHLFALSSAVVTETRHLEAVRIFAQTLVTISDGELEQLRRLNRLPTHEEYLRLIHAKTACLFQSAALCGALLSGRPADEAALFGEYGRNLGLAFQIADDVLDYVGDPDQMGKPTLNDMKRGVLTLPALLYMWERGGWETARVPEKTDELRVAKLVAKVVEGGYIERALDLARQYADAAWHNIEPLVGGEYGESLRGLSQFALERVD